MHDHGLDDRGMNHDATLGAALRALPAGAPPADAWSHLSARLRRRRGLRRTVWYSLPAAFAAAIALALVLPHTYLHTHAPAPRRVAAQSHTRAASVVAPDIAALQASSAQWQAWVRKLARDGAPLEGPQLARAVTLQDRIGLVDLQLSAARKTSTVAGLWQQRITLLQQLGLLHLQPYLVAERAQPAATRSINL